MSMLLRKEKMLVERSFRTSPSGYSTGTGDAQVTPVAQDGADLIFPQQP